MSWVIEHHHNPLEQLQFLGLQNFWDMVTLPCSAWKGQRSLKSPLADTNFCDLSPETLNSLWKIGS